ncbi:hypothetical protein IU450_06270 [Nocardia abscessus]|uniref:hypothetical protein n=1 Tax=Nocardia abscessus TaxID=120957 RepID=UPI001895B7F9|nr:hypothetical protein [Nocardia abscessus]MBF6335488.1 hypothetical protein [Nocardia abscessus]
MIISDDGHLTDFVGNLAAKCAGRVAHGSAERTQVDLGAQHRRDTMILWTPMEIPCCTPW